MKDVLAVIVKEHFITQIFLNTVDKAKKEMELIKPYYTASFLVHMLFDCDELTKCLSDDKSYFQLIRVKQYYSFILLIIID